MQVDIRARF